MNTKLTLSLDSKVIESAKKYSRQKGISLSKIIEDYLKKLTPKKSLKRRSSITELKGIAGSASPDFDYKEEIFKYLSEKHK